MKERWITYVALAFITLGLSPYVAYTAASFGADIPVPGAASAFLVAAGAIALGVVLMNKTLRRLLAKQTIGRFITPKGGTEE